MKIWRIAIGVSCLIAFSSFAATNMTEEMVKVLETNLPAVIGTILGGIIAAATFLFTILRDFTHKKMLESTKEKKEGIALQYKMTAESVKQDLFTLTLCLLFTLILPVVRIHPINKIIIIINNSLEFTPIIIFTFFEIFTLLLSITIIWELIGTIFLALQEEI